MSGTPDVAAVVLSLNAEDLLPSALAAIRNQTVGVSRIVVVDNGSTDGTREVLSADDIVPVLLATNSGVGAGHNVGWATALADMRVPDFIWALEHDTEPENRCLERLIEVFHRLTARGHLVAAVVPRQVLPGRTQEFPPGADPEPFVAPRLTFNATLFNVRAIQCVGRLREDFFVGHEDREYATRLAAAGFLVVHDPEAIVVHRNKGRRRRGDRSVLRDYYSFRNELYLRREIRGEPLVLAKLGLRSAGHIARIIVTGDQRRRRIHSRARAFVDGARCDLGEKHYAFLAGDAHG